MDDPFSIFGKVKDIADLVKVDWVEGTFGPWLGELNVMAWPLSCKHSATDPVYDYYMIQVEGAVSYQDRGGEWSPVGFGVDVVPVAPTPLTLIDMLDTSPSTTVGATSYTTGITHTVGGSIGFFGDQLTGSVNASVSWNNSSSRSTSDLVIQNVSMRDMEPPIKASWRFEVAPDTPLAGSDCPINVEVLYRAPHGHAALSIQVVHSVYMTGSSWEGNSLRVRYLELLRDDPRGTGGLDESELGNLDKEFPHATVQIMDPSDFKAQPGLTDDYYLDKSCIRVRKTITLVAPPPPHTESAG